MKSRLFVSFELFILFILLPICLSIGYPFWIKIILIVLGFAYILVVLLRIEKISVRFKKRLDWLQFWKRIMILFLVIAIITTGYTFWLDPGKLFCVLMNKPKLWLVILLIYTLLSVWPQEVIYRTFFFARYERLFQNKKLFLFVNAIIFSLAHIFFKNTLVMVLTFLGGLLFAFTYFKTRSTLMISIEHALYGNWLFTVGMGQMLAFPGMESC